MRKALLLLLLLAAPAIGQDGPLARLSGPARVEVGATLYLNASGTLSDDPPDILVTRTPGGVKEADVGIIPLFAPDGKGGYRFVTAMVTLPGVAGSYEFCNVAERRPKDGGRTRHVATHDVLAGNAPAPVPPTPPPGPGPNPPTPVPPNPVPPNPDPPAPPTPTFGVPEWIFILHESADPTSARAFNTERIRAPLNAAVPASRMPDGREIPQWRILDRDTDLSAASEPFKSAFTAALAKHGNATAPALYAVDKAGRIKAVPIPATMTTDQLIAEIQKLGPVATPQEGP